MLDFFKKRQFPHACKTLLERFPLGILIYYGLYWSYSQGIPECLSILESVRLLIAFSDIMLLLCGPKEAYEFLHRFIRKDGFLRCRYILLFALVYSLLCLVLTLPAELVLRQSSENGVLIIPLVTFTISIATFPAMHIFLDFLTYGLSRLNPLIRFYFLELIIFFLVNTLTELLHANSYISVGSVCVTVVCFLEFFYRDVYSQDENDPM